MFHAAMLFVIKTKSVLIGYIFSSLEIAVDKMETQSPTLPEVLLISVTCGHPRSENVT